MLSTLKESTVSLLEQIAERLENAEDKPKALEQDKSEQDKQEQPATEERLQIAIEKLMTSAKLRGAEKLEILRQNQYYVSANQRLHLEANAEKMFNLSVDLYHNLEDKVIIPVRERLLVIWDRSTQLISFVTEHFVQNKEQLLTYVNKHYANAKLVIHQQWVRLDYNGDGQVSVEDVKSSAVGLYKFLQEFEYRQRALEIKSNLYEQALTMIKGREEAHSPASGQEAQGPREESHEPKEEKPQEEKAQEGKPHEEKPHEEKPHEEKPQEHKEESG